MGFCIPGQEVKIVVVVLAILAAKTIAAPASEEHATPVSKSRNVRQTVHERCPEKHQRVLKGNSTDCPWYYCVDIDENRVPKILNIAMCHNEKELPRGFQCERVLYNMTVFRKGPGTGECNLTESRERIAVACGKKKIAARG